MFLRGIPACAMRLTIARSSIVGRCLPLIMTIYFTPYYLDIAFFLYIALLPVFTATLSLTAIALSSVNSLDCTSSTCFVSSLISLTNSSLNNMVGSCLDTSAITSLTDSSTICSIGLGLSLALIFPVAKHIVQSLTIIPKPATFLVPLQVGHLIIAIVIVISLYSTKY